MLLDSFFCIASPVHLVDCQNDLSWPVDDPLGSGSYFEISLALLNELEESVSHLFFDL